MDILSSGVLVDVFELEAAVGLALPAVVFWALVRALFDGEHRHGNQAHVRRTR
jgi:Arc/MetJ family transcription regulator